MLRLALAICLVGAAMICAPGCSLTPGASPSEIRAAYSTAGYVDRDFNDMQPDLP